MPLFESVMHSFQAVAHHGSIRRASEHLHMTPSAVDRQILKLERDLGVALFERLPRGVRLTAAGELLLGATRRLHRELESTISQIDALRGLRRGSAVVMSLQFLADALLPGVVADLRRSHPGVGYAVHTETSEAILRAVVNGDADIGICHAPPRGLPLTVVLRVPARLGAVFRPGHALAAHTRLRMADCLAYPLILPRAGMELRAIIEASRPRALLEFQPAIETNSISMLKAMLMRDVGVGFLTNQDVADEVRRGDLQFLQLADRQGAAPDLCLIVRAARVLPVAADLFLQQVQPALAALAPE